MALEMLWGFDYDGRLYLGGGDEASITEVFFLVLYGKGASYTL